MAKAPSKAAAKPPAEGTMRIVALRNLQVDGQTIAEGETADIRAELVDALLDCGAAQLAEDMD